MRNGRSTSWKTLGMVMKAIGSAQFVYGSDLPLCYMGMYDRDNAPEFWCDLPFHFIATKFRGVVSVWNRSLPAMAVWGQNRRQNARAVSTSPAARAYMCVVQRGGRSAVYVRVGTDDSSIDTFHKIVYSYLSYFLLYISTAIHIYSLLITLLNCNEFLWNPK